MNCCFFAGWESGIFGCFFFKKMCFFAVEMGFFLIFHHFFQIDVLIEKPDNFCGFDRKIVIFHGFVSKSPHRLTDVPIFPKAFWAKPWQALEISQRFGLNVTCLLFKVAKILYPMKMINVTTRTTTIELEALKFLHSARCSMAFETDLDSAGHTFGNSAHWARAIQAIWFPFKHRTK